MKRLLLLIFISFIAFAQPKDSTVVLEKNEFIGVIKGIKYLEAKDSLTMELTQQYEQQVDNYKQLHDKDSLQLYNATKWVTAVTDERNKVVIDLNDCQNPPFYKTQTTSFILGMLTVILISIAL